MNQETNQNSPTKPPRSPTAFTICPRCNYPHKDAHQAAAGRAGGKAKVPKGLSSPEVQKKAQTALAVVRAAKREAKAKEKAEATAPPPQ